MPVIKRSSPLFCMMILMGLIMIWVSLIFWSGDQNGFTCNIKVWLGLVGYATVMSNMLVKTWRIWKIFDTSKLRARAIHNKDLMVGSSAITAIQVALLLFWTLYDPPVPVLKQSSLSDFYQYQECQGSNAVFQTVWGAVVLSLNAILIIAGAVLAFFTRNVTSSFNASKYIALCMYNLVICLVHLVLVYLSTADNEGYAARTYLIRSLANLFPSIFSMYALFAPKIYRLLFHGGTGCQNDLRTNMGPGFLGNGGGGIGKNVKSPVGIKKPAKLKDSSNAYSTMKIMKMAATGGQPDTGMPAKNSVLAESMDSTSLWGWIRASKLCQWKNFRQLPKAPTILKQRSVPTNP